MGGSRYRRFNGYQRSGELADRLEQEVAGWDKFAQWTVGIQLVRAADSVGANIAESFGRGAGADRRRILLIARGSLTELEHWIERANARGLLARDRYATDVAEVARLINGLIRSERIG